MIIAVSIVVTISINDLVSKVVVICSYLGTLIYRIILQQTLLLFGKVPACMSLFQPSLIFEKEGNNSAGRTKNCHPLQLSI